MNMSVIAKRPQLLISVSSAAECTAALQPGVDLIDIKDPTRGSLGRATLRTIVDVLQAVNHRVPVSVAMGELCEFEPARLAELPAGLSYIKFGLSGCASLKPGWQRDLDLALRHAPRGASLVPVAYADDERASAPRWEEVLAFTAERKLKVILVDTFDKGAGQLLDWKTPAELQSWVRAAQSRRIRIALAGSLSIVDLPVVCRCGADIIAVRSAATEGGRSQPVSAAAVQRLVEKISLETPQQVD